MGLACVAVLAQQPAGDAKTKGDAKAAADGKPQTQTEKYSYIYGVNAGRTFRRQEITPDNAAFMRGFTDGLASDDKILFSDNEMNEIYRATQKEVRTRYEEKRKIAAEQNEKEGAAFLLANKSKPDVKTTASGLQYKIINPGSGESPKTNDNVTVQYRGTLINGTEFDSSYKSGRPAKFQVSGVIKGWTEALTMMKPGAKWQLFIPSNLAYGEQGQGQKIMPNATLLFDIELVAINPMPPAPPVPGGTPSVTSDIIKVPSAEDLKKGAKVEVIKPEDIEKEKAKQQIKK